MKKFFKQSRILFLAIPVTLMVVLAIGCDSPSEPASETDTIIVDTPTHGPIDTLPTIDTLVGDKPPVPIRN